MKVSPAWMRKHDLINWNFMVRKLREIVVSKKKKKTRLCKWVGHLRKIQLENHIWEV